MVAGNSLGIENNIFGQLKTSRGAGFPPEGYSDLLFSYSGETFKKLIGSQFTLYAEKSAQSAVLVEIKEGSMAKGKTVSRIKNRSTEEFMLSFRVSSAEMEQATYQVFHPELGQFDLLLVPAKNKKGENLLNAIINRL